MHVSLDSALGRQRRLNSVGESVLQIAPNAAAAYSLRSLTGGDPKVVRVRRSSNNAEQDFTSSEVSSGALTSFVNEIQTLGTVTNSVGNDGFALTNKSSTGFTATTDTATGVCGWPYTAKSGDKITVSFDAVVRSGTPQFIPRKATALSGSNLVDVVSDSAISVNSTASYSFEFTYDSDEAGSLTFSEGDDNADFDISNFQVTAFKGAGFVETWYDQSGNIKSAVQATAGNQPKIVNSGSLVVSNGSPAVFFTGDTRDDELDFADLTLTDAAIFTVVDIDSSADQQILLGGSASTTTGTMIAIMDNGSSSTEVYKNSTVGSQFKNGSAITLSNRDGAFDGLAVDEQILFTMIDVDVAEAKVLDGISRCPANATTFHLQGKMNELIIYNSDQSVKRTAIEANINSHYSIF